MYVGLYYFIKTKMILEYELRKKKIQTHVFNYSKEKKSLLG